MTIRTTHVGSLPRTPELIEANRARREGSLATLISRRFCRIRLTAL